MAETHHTPAHHHEAPGKDPSKMLVNILTIIGLIILIVIVIWGLLHIARLSSSWFSGFFSNTPKEAITVTAPSAAPAGAPFALSWSYEPSEAGSYALIYKCEDGLQLAVPTQTGIFHSVPCGASYTLGTSTQTAVLPVLAASSSIKAMLSILYLPAQRRDGAPAQGSASVNITPGTTPPPVSEGTKPEPETPAGPQPTGTADLTVRVLAVGVIDASGAFVPRQPVNQYEMAAVQFDVVNVGTGTSGSYTFMAQLPTSQPYTYASPVQEPLAPGSHVVNTLRFTQAVSGTFMVTVNGDAIPGNNSASQFISVPYQVQYSSPAYPYIPPQYMY
jgi:hypothetical protein